MTSKTIEELFNDRELNDIIIKMTSYRNDYKNAKSELFYILCENDTIESIPTYKEQIYHCISILKNTIHSKSSSYWKEFYNMGFPSSKERNDEHDMTYTYEDEYDESEYEKWKIIINRINTILNTEIPWYESHLFRLYYLPFPDPHCEKITYSLRDIEKMHTYGSYKIDHVAIFYKVNKVMKYIINKLISEKLITPQDIQSNKIKKMLKYDIN